MRNYKEKTKKANCRTQLEIPENYKDKNRKSNWEKVTERRL